MATVNEGSRMTITAIPMNEQGSPFTPASARWKINDKASGTEIAAWTVVSDLSAQMEIEIAASNNDIIDSNLSLEEKVFTFSTDYGTDDQHNAELVYEVRNLNFIT